MQIIELQLNTGVFLEASINISSATTTAVIAARAGYVTRVYKMIMTVGAAQTVDIKDGSTSLTGGPLGFASSGIVNLHMDQTPWFTTTAGTALNFTTTTTGQTSGRIYYTQTRSGE